MWPVVMDQTAQIQNHSIIIEAPREHETLLFCGLRSGHYPASFSKQHRTTCSTRVSHAYLCLYPAQIFEKPAPNSGVWRSAFKILCASLYLTMQWWNYLTSYVTVDLNQTSCSLLRSQHHAQRWACGKNSNVGLLRCNKSCKGRAIVWTLLNKWPTSVV